MENTAFYLYMYIYIYIRIYLRSVWNVKRTRIKRESNSTRKAETV